MIDRRICIFKIKEVHFSESPFDIKGCDFLKFYFCKDKVNFEGFTRQKKLTLIIDLTQDLDTIWRNMNRTTRRFINKAKRMGIKVRINDNYETFYKIYKSFIKKRGIISVFKIFGVGILKLETMKKNGTLFVAEYNGEILGGRIYLEGQSSIESWFSASKRLDVDREKAKIISYANRLLHWEAIKYAKEKGIEKYNFGGLWSEEEAEKDKGKWGINSFKLSFGGKIATCYSYHKFFSKIYNLAYNLYGLKNLGRQV